MKWYIDKGPEADVVLSSRIRLARNLSNFPFPHKTNNEQQNQIIEEVKDIFLSDKQETYDFKYIDVNNISTVDKLELIEKHVISKELLNCSRKTGVILSNDERISIMINEEDHIRIQCLFSGMQMDKAWEMCNDIDNMLEEKLDFAFSEELGYLTSCPTNIGTAIRASVMLHLPALTMTGYIRTILDACGKLGIAVRGLFGENTEASGDMFQMSNQITLGKKEKDIIMNIKNITYQIIEQERSLRKELYKQNKYKFEDKIYRSYGILKNSRIISTDEALKKLSDIRLGVDLGIISDISITDINEIMLLIQPGGLQKIVGRELQQEDRDIVRAERIRSKLTNLKGSEII